MCAQCHYLKIKESLFFFFLKWVLWCVDMEHSCPASGPLCGLLLLLLVLVFLFLLLLVFLLINSVA